MRRLVSIILIVLATLPVLLLTWLFARVTDRIGSPFSEQRFSQSAWQAMKYSQNRHGRASMVRDLIENHLRPGMPETVITSLLGIQDKTWPVDEYSPPLPHAVYEYDMGLAPMDLAGQRYVVRLFFDQQGHYQRAEITRD